MYIQVNIKSIKDFCGVLMQKLLLIGTGGFFGSVLRYLISGWVSTLMNQPVFPYGTLAVNTAGCLLIGFLGGLSETRQLFTPEARIFLFIGLLGGFTTFSTFGYETVTLLRSGQLFSTFLNIGLHLALGLAAVIAGIIVSRLV